MPKQPSDTPPPEDPAQITAAWRTEAQDRSRRVNRIGVWVLMISLTPVAAFLAGFCCCFGTAIAGANPGGWLGPIWLEISFIFGVLLGGGLTIYLCSRWLARLN